MGKPSSAIDEARRWQVKALEFADRGDEGAVAAMMSLVMGMRASEIVSRVVRDLDDEGRLLWIPETKTEAGKRTLPVPEFLQPYLRDIIKGKKPTDLLFGRHWRDWPREWVQRICKVAKVPQVTAHGMRGLHGTLAVERGATTHVVAQALGHESETTSRESYISREAITGADQRRVLGVLAGASRRRHPPRNNRALTPRRGNDSQNFITRGAPRRKKHQQYRGAERDRTVGLLSAIQIESQWLRQLTKTIIPTKGETSAVSIACGGTIGIVRDGAREVGDGWPRLRLLA